VHDLTQALPAFPLLIFLTLLFAFRPLHCPNSVFNPEDELSSPDNMVEARPALRNRSSLSFSKAARIDGSFSAGTFGFCIICGAGADEPPKNPMLNLL
jgi:hypothetical protein